MNIAYLNALRLQELAFVTTRYRKLFVGHRILEIGSGTGAQLAALKGIGSLVIGLEVQNSTYGDVPYAGVVTYDGVTLPFQDGSFDLIYSSNVLEHIAHRREFQCEIHRVLDEDGYCVHVLPSHYWKMSTVAVSILLAPFRIVHRLWRSAHSASWELPRSLAAALDLVVGERHGEFGTRFTELFHFMPSAWEKFFRTCQWEVVEVRPCRLAYEGNMLIAAIASMTCRRRTVHTSSGLANWTWQVRRCLSYVFGSATYAYLLRRARNDNASVAASTD